MNALKHNIMLLKDKKGTSVNSPAFLEMMDSVMKKFQSAVTSKPPEKPRKKNSFTVVDRRKRSCMASYHKPLDDPKKFKTRDYRLDSKQFPSLSADDLKRSRRPVLQKGDIDHFDGSVATSNRYAGLRDDMSMSDTDSDEEIKALRHKKWVERQNAQYI